MATDVSMCSGALLILGANPINSFDDSANLPRAKLASNLWPLFRDWFLRSHPWNAATKYVLLAPEVGAPPFDYTYQFLLPDDWLRTLQIGERGCPVDFKPVGRKLYCDENPLPLVYIARVNEGTWDTAMQFAAMEGMAALMAYAVTQSQAVADSHFNKFSMMMKGVRAVDGQDAPPEQLGDFRLFASRFSSGFPSISG